MNKEFLKAAAQDMKKQALFECCYFDGLKATYAIYDDNVEGGADMKGAPIWFRTIDIRTLAVVQERSDKRFWGDGMCALRCVIEKHYMPEYICHDALTQAAELFSDIHMGRLSGRDGLNHMHDSILFGQAVYFADVQELGWKNEDGKEFTVSSTGYLIEYPNGCVEDFSLKGEAAKRMEQEAIILGEMMKAQVIMESKA